MKKINPGTDLASIEDCQYLIHIKRLSYEKDNKLFWGGAIKAFNLLYPSNGNKLI